MSFPIVGAAGMPVPMFEVDGPHIEEEGRGSKALCFLRGFWGAACGMCGCVLGRDWIFFDFFDFCA